ncbi:MAG TPA: family 16 glycoside hydrolase [Vicinamibacterales bacterium]|nr:family 16 glycoside hydrolase [Vicinamibacterales bacterium]
MNGRLSHVLAVAGRTLIVGFVLVGVAVAGAAVLRPVRVASLRVSTPAAPAAAKITPVAPKIVEPAPDPAPRPALTKRVRAERPGPRRQASEPRHALRRAELDRRFDPPAREREDAEARPDHPGEAVAFWNMSLRDEHGAIPFDGLVKAQAQLRAMQRRALLDPQPIAGIANNTWTWLGPTNVGGRTRAIAIDPGTPSTMFIGGVGGGIWKSTNGGASWAPVNDFMANLAVSSIIYDPGDSSTMYAGTGEGFYNIDGIRGAGVFKSTDGGATWNQLAATNNTNFLYVNRLAESADGGTLLVATQSGLFRSTDGGATFSTVLQPDTIGYHDITDVKFLPGSSTLVVASGYFSDIHYSSNGGATWAAASGPSWGTYSFERVELGVSVSNPSIVYAMQDVSNGRLWRSTDSGHTFAIVGVPAHLNNQGWYDNVIWVDPVNADDIVIGGLDLWRSTNAASTAVSVTFSKISDWRYGPPNSSLSAHADQHAIVSDPGYNGTSNRRVFFGNDGGIFKTEDLDAVTTTSGWTNLNNGYGVTQFYGAAGHAGTGKIQGGAQDNGTLYSSGTSTTFSAPFGGDGGMAAYDPADSNYFYGEYVYGRVHRNSTGGSSPSEYIWVPSDGGCTAPYCLSDAEQGFANFIAPITLDPNDANTLYVGARSLWRTGDVKTPVTSATGPTWASLTSPSSSGNYISAVAVAPGNSNLVWIGYNDGEVFMTANAMSGSPTWSELSGLPARQVLDIAIDATNNAVVYVTFGGYSSGNLWYTTNSGATWVSRSGSGGSALPAAPVRAVAIHPSNSSWLYAGTEVGLFTSEDDGASWHAPQDGPANVAVDDLFFLNSTLYAATHGRGLFKTATLPSQSAKVLALSSVSGAQVGGSAVLWAHVQNSGTTALPSDAVVWFKVTGPGGATHIRVPLSQMAPVASGLSNPWVGNASVSALAAGSDAWYSYTWSIGSGETAGSYAYTAEVWGTVGGVNRMMAGSSYSQAFTVAAAPAAVAASVLAGYPVNGAGVGTTAALWAHVKNTGTAALPGGATVYFLVTNPSGTNTWVGPTSVAGLASGADAWYSFAWSIPGTASPGTYRYTAQVWSTGAISGFGPTIAFSVAAGPTARIDAVWPVTNGTPGGTAMLWAQVHNTGTVALPSGSKVWFFVDGPNWSGDHWVGSADVSGLAAGAVQWYSYNWTIASSVGTFYYWGQVWASGTAISSFSAGQAFAVAIDSEFNGNSTGWTDVSGTWTTDANDLTSTGVSNASASIERPGTFGDVDYTARLWRNGCDTCASEVIVRGTSSPVTASQQWAAWYAFQYTRDGHFSVIKNVGGVTTTITPSTASSAIVQGNAWNTLRVVAHGTSLSFSINGTVVWSGTDTSLAAGSVGIGLERDAVTTGNQLWVDYAKIGG